VHVGRMDIIRRDEVHFEIEELQALGLARQDLLLREGTVADLLRDNLRVKRVDIFILGGEVH